MTKTRINRKRHLAGGIVGTALALGLAGCSDRVTTPSTEPPPEVPSSGRHLGVVEITLTGLAEGGTVRTTAVSAPTVAALAAMREAGRGGLRSQDLDAPVQSGGGGDGTIELEPLSTGSLTEGQRGNGGVRYVWATYRVRNAQADGTAYDTPRQNLTLLAVDTDGTAGTTPFSQFKRFDGSSADAGIAAATQPTGAVMRDPLTGTVTAAGPDVLQAFTEGEAAAVTLPAGVHTVFPYGFVVRRAGNAATRTLPANPASDAFDGVITIAYRIPLQATAADDPFTISVILLPVDDQETRITQSLEEQDTKSQAAFEARAAALGATTLTVLPGSAVSGASVRSLCSVRTAGSAGSPTGYLVNDPCGLTTWTGAVDSNWNVAGNWFPTIVPVPTDSVLVPLAGTQPALTTPVTIARLRLAAGTTLDLATHILTSNGGVVVAETGQITASGGTLLLAGSAAPVTGRLPSTTITGGYAVSAPIHLTGALRIGDGSLRTGAAPITIHIDMP